LSYSILSSSL
jgi:predicted RNase H-like nuclease (RuvC/YqgF family)